MIFRTRPLMSFYFPSGIIRSELKECILRAHFSNGLMASLAHVLDECIFEFQSGYCCVSVIPRIFSPLAVLGSASTGSSQICKGSSPAGFRAPSCRIGIQVVSAASIYYTGIQHICPELSLSLARKGIPILMGMRIPSADHQICPA